jgi:serine/threonine protein kinase
LPLVSSEYMGLLEDIVSKVEKIKQFPSWRTKRLMDLHLPNSFFKLSEDLGGILWEFKETFKSFKSDLGSLLHNSDNTFTHKNEEVCLAHRGHHYLKVKNPTEDIHKLIYERLEDINSNLNHKLLNSLIKYHNNKDKLMNYFFLRRAIIRSPYLNLMVGFKDHYESINQLINDEKSHYHFDLLSQNFEKVIMESKFTGDSLKDIFYHVDTTMAPLKGYDHLLIKVLPHLSEKKAESLNQILDESVYKYNLALSSLDEIDNLELNAYSRIPLVLKTKIGGGADRDVFTALNHSGENCIVKIIDVSRLREEDKELFEYYFNKSIVPEKEHAEELSQHNIVPVYGFGPCYYKNKPTWYIVEKLISNQAIKNGIKNISDQPSNNFEQLLAPMKGGLPFGIFSTIFYGDKGHGLIQAVDYLHRQGKTFGDIKPDNVAIQQITNFDEGTVLFRPYFCDLENIRNLTLDSNVSGLTNHSHIYQPPEKFDENGEFILGLNTTQADIFAMGVTMFIALTGVHPFLPKYENLTEIRSERAKGPEQRRKMNQEYLNNLHDRKYFSVLSERLNERLNDKNVVEFLPNSNHIWGMVIGSIIPETEKRLPSGAHLNEHFKIYSEKYNQAKQTEEYQRYLARVEKFSDKNFEGRKLDLK